MGFRSGPTGIGLRKGLRGAPKPGRKEGARADKAEPPAGAAAAQCKCTSGCCRVSHSSRRNEARIDQFTERSIASGLAQRVTRRVITIPVVVHVVHKRPSENISEGPDQKPDQRPESRLSRHQPRQEQGSGRLAGADRQRQRQVRPGNAAIRRGRRPTASREPRPPQSSFGDDDSVKYPSKGGANPWPQQAIPQPLGMQPGRRPAGLRAVPGRPGVAPTGW